MAASEGAVARTRRARKPAAAQGAAPLPWLKPGIFIGALAPLASIGVRASQGALSADPIAQVINELGLTALIFLVASLACTPARRLFGWTWAIRIRRQLGLFAFFYASLHFLTYLFVDHGLNWGIIVEDVVERPFVTVGFAALVLLLPLAVTSTTWSIRRLGYRRWQRLHMLVYAAAALAVLHFIWRVKIDLSQPLTYAGVVAALLLVRVAVWLRQRSIDTDKSPTRGSPPR